MKKVLLLCVSSLLSSFMLQAAEEKVAAAYVKAFASHPLSSPFCTRLIPCLLLVSYHAKNGLLVKDVQRSFEILHGLPAEHQDVVEMIEGPRVKPLAKLDLAENGYDENLRQKVVFSGLQFNVVPSGYNKRRLMLYGEGLLDPYPVIFELGVGAGHFFKQLHNAYVTALRKRGILGERELAACTFSCYQCGEAYDSDELRQLRFLDFLCLGNCICRKSLGADGSVELGVMPVSYAIRGRYTRQESAKGSGCCIS